ncbi:PPC domain-containing protein [Paenibacillus assamensis]|uniref:PPC domain-containing protein n=1 Tax=Paenibacillus assamensis TaxID=311244 RepID=UPI00042169C1|nr:PPC domain-containing protein [Paenibacillus assamensis]
MKKVLLSLFGAMLIVGSSAGAAFASGDTPDRANKITLSIETGYVSGTDVDYWYFIPDRSGSYRIQLTGLEQDADLYLYDKFGNDLWELGKSEKSGIKNEEIIYNLDQGTKYYIKVESHNGVRTPYTLDIDRN